MWALFAGNDAPLDMCAGEPLDVTMHTFQETLFLLFLGTLTGDLTTELQCAQVSSHPQTATAILATFQLAAGLLLVNSAARGARTLP